MFSALQEAPLIKGFSHAAAGARSFDFRIQNASDCKEYIDAKTLKETHKPVSGFGRRYLPKRKENDCPLKVEGASRFFRANALAFSCCEGSV